MSETGQTGRAWWIPHCARPIGRPRLRSRLRVWPSSSLRLRLRSKRRRVGLIVAQPEPQPSPPSVGKARALREHRRSTGPVPPLLQAGSRLSPLVVPLVGSSPWGSSSFFSFRCSSPSHRHSPNPASTRSTRVNLKGTDLE